MRDYIAIAKQYANDVTNGKQVACTFVKQAVKRFNIDLKRKNWPFRFDKDKAIKVCAFAENITHAKGELANTLIHLEPWQVFILVNIFGFVDKDGYRRYQRAYIEVPRGNGKSTLCSIIMLYMLCADNEKGSDCYSFATTKDQARIVFNDAQAMARANKPLREAFNLNVLAHSMVVLGTNSKALALSADDNKLDGLNTHLGIIDELHAHKTRGVYDVVETSIGKRKQPLLFCITTAGFNLTGICMELRRYVSKILNCTVPDDRQFGIIYTIDSNDDWKSEEALIKANPNWNISVMPDAILSNLAKAKVEPSAENNYKTKHLNVWCNANSAWLPMDSLKSCMSDIKERDFINCYCVMGMDLATKEDLACIVKVYVAYGDDGKAHYYIFPHFFLPSDTVMNSRNASYKGWASNGYIEQCEGATNDMIYIKDSALNLAQISNDKLVAFAYDPWQATETAQNLINNGVPMVEIRPNVQNFSEPMKVLKAMILEKRVHINNPVMEWCLSNVVCHTDANDNIYPRKETSDNKIDGAVALIMAFNQIIHQDIENNYLGAENTQIEGLYF